MEKDFFKILKDIAHNQNGVVSDMMKEFGLLYSQNHGANIFMIKKIANKYPKNNQLAFDLMDVDIREASLIASYLLNIDDLTKDDIDKIVEKCITNELCEHIVKNTLSKSVIAQCEATRYCESDNLLTQYVGYLILYWGNVSNIEISELKKNIQKTCKNLNVNLNRIIVNLLVKIANRDKSSRTEILAAIMVLPKEISEETKAFIGE